MPYTTAEAKRLDKFYTKAAAADLTIEIAGGFLASVGEGWGEKTVIEPSAGSGAFLRGLHERGPKRVIALDIEPESDLITKRDFLSWAGPDEEPEAVITIGNPPFGKNGKLALSFLNLSLQMSRDVVMILPVTFRKWSLHKKIVPGAFLYEDVDIPEDSFTLNDQTYEVRCCVQLWSRVPPALCGRDDLRIRTSPPISHPDFECWQYNATRDALKYFGYDWDFGVLRQGYGDYGARLRKGDPISEKKQWIFFKAKNPEVLERLMAMDFDKLSRSNTSVRGFGKAQVVAEYERLLRDV